MELPFGATEESVEKIGESSSQAGEITNEVDNILKNTFTSKSCIDSHLVLNS
jgi:hypothetical protein